jgi:aspartate/methionine/tyrosine aminotransferase
VLATFQLEDFFAEWEFKARYLLCSSDAESWSLNDVLSFADKETTDLWNNLRLSYTEVYGLPLLRTEIATLYPGCSSENVLCLAGAEEGIFCAATALLSSGDHAIVVIPCYQSLFEIPKHTGANVSTIPLSEAESWQLDLNKIESAIRPNTKMLWINFPHNPTGARLRTDQLNQIVTLAREHNMILFSDEVYRLLDGNETTPEPPAASLYERALSLGVMSKSYGMAGLRIGWLASQDQELLKKIERVKHYTSICNSAPAEVLALIALRAQDKLLARNNGIVRENLAMLEPFFQEYSSLFAWVKPKGGCVGFPRYRGAEGIDLFSEELVARTGVLLLPGRVYDWPGNYFRLGFGRKNFAEGLSKLKSFVDEKSKATRVS